MLTIKALEYEQSASYHINENAENAKKQDEPSADAQITVQKEATIYQIDASEKMPSKETSMHTLSWYRFVVIAMYFLIKFTSGAAYGLYIPYSDYLQEIYGIMHIYVVISAYAFQCLSPFVIIIYANKLILYAGTKISVLLFELLV